MKYADAMAEFGVSEVVARAYEACEPLAVGDAENGYALLWFLDANLGQIEDLESYVRARNGRSGWGNMLDADEVPDAAIPWLGQFVGVAVDPNSTVAPRDQLRKHVRFNRGSRQGIQDYLDSFLLPGHHVEILERVRVTGGVETDNLPWNYTVIAHHATIAAARYVDLEVQYPTYAGLAGASATYGDIPAGVPALAAAVQASKPGGDLAWFYFVASGTSIYRELNPGDPITGMPFPRYTDLAAALPTYADVDNYAPP